MNVNVLTLVGVASAICGIVFGYIGYRQGAKRENVQTGTLLSDIGYIKSGVDDLKRKQETSDDRHFALAERVTKVEESTKQAHKRIDRMETERE